MINDDQNVIGLKDFRDNLFDLFDTVVERNNIIRIGNIKTKGKSATIMPTELLKILISSKEFEPIMNYNQISKHWEIIIEEIGAMEYAGSVEECVEKILDMSEAIMLDYFENIETYIISDKYIKQLPYMIKIRDCNNRDELRILMNLNNIIERQHNLIGTMVDIV